MLYGDTGILRSIKYLITTFGYGCKVIKIYELYGNSNRSWADVKRIKYVPDFPASGCWVVAVMADMGNRKEGGM